MSHFNSGSCPICKSKLNIARLSCPECRAEFPLNEPMNPFAYLNSSQIEFMEAFMKNRGSIKAVCEYLNCSYPTARKKLDDLLISLGYAEKEMSSHGVADNMGFIEPTVNATKASEIIRNKFIESVSAGKDITVYSYKGTPYQFYLVDNGKQFDCSKIKPYPFEIFDVMVDVMLENGGKAKKGNAHKRLGDKGCEEDTIAGALLKNYYGLKPGGSGLDPSSFLIPVLEWAGIAKSEWGYVQLTSEFLSLIRG